MRLLLIAVAMLTIASGAFAQTTQPPVVNALTDNYATLSGSIDQWGVWQNSAAPGTGGTWTWTGPSGAIANTFDVTAKVELWERDQLDANLVDFHFGHTAQVTGSDSPLVAEEVEAVLTGSVQANNNVTIDIVAPAGCSSISKLLYVDGSGYFNDAGSFIPITWEYKLAGASSWSPCDTTSVATKAIAFPGGFGTNKVDQDFNIKITAKPEALQADGSYHLDPVICVTPTL